MNTMPEVLSLNDLDLVVLPPASSWRASVDGSSEFDLQQVSCCLPNKSMD